MLSKQLSLNKSVCTRASPIFCSNRPAHSSASSAVDNVTFKFKPEELDNPNIFQRIYLRFMGIPLKGETQRPKSAFDDIGKYQLFEPLPQVPKDFKEYPERDLVNFPYPNKPLYSPKTRLLIIPDSWCKEVEKITGTSGPYVFLGGLLTFLLSKELIVLNEDWFFVWFGWIPMYLALCTAFRFRSEKSGYAKFLKNWADKQAFIDNELKDAVEFRQAAKAQAESFKAAHENFPTIFRENLALQLEATYRKNVDYAWQEMKRRLDYLQEVQATKDRFIREVLLNTITQGVRKQIETNEGGIRDKYLDQCIEQLRVLAPK